MRGLLRIGVFLLAALPAAAEAPAHPWRSFPVGSWVKHRVTTTIWMAETTQTAVAETRRTVKEVTATDVAVEEETLLAGQTVRSTTRYPLAPTDPPDDPDAPKPIHEGEEDLDIAGRHLHTRTRRLEKVKEGSRSVIDLFECPEVPGHLVRKTVRTEGVFRSEMDTELLDFETK